ncbi:sensor histidine kinase [Ornithinimicrobium sp. W1679]|uniref:sensor histidine kinase n=1 Tax=Ornithinimicrobium sp. W1679 TaxID=3418770 RepID=UPI003CF7FB3D
MEHGVSHAPRVRGILAPAGGLDRWLQVVLLALVLACALRYVDRHGLGPTGQVVLAGAAGFALVYAARAAVPTGAGGPVAWVLLTTALWTSLTLAAPSFAWTAVPVAFAVLQVLPFSWAAGVVVLMTAVVSAGWLRIAERFDVTIVVGPVGIALVTVVAYRSLERESTARQLLLDELTAAQVDLAAAQRQSGALAERTRLSREIHDSVGQGLSSINLLLNAAQQDWDRSPEVARAHVRTAASTARDELEEVRRVVRDLAPAGLDGDVHGAALPAAVRRLVEVDAHGLDASVHVHGAPVPVPPDVGTAVMRSARGALANAVEHADARTVVVTLTYHPDELLLDVRDDGRGFDPARPGTGGARGRGLNGIHHRAKELGGQATVESSPGEGTTLSVAFPLDGRS